MQQQVSGMHNGMMDPGAVGKCPAYFSWRAKQKDPNKPECEKVAYITILIPGGFIPDVVERPVKDKDKIDYPREWALFQEGKDSSEVGWPIDKCPFLDVAQAATYKLMGILNMENLAGASDTVLQNVMGGLTHRDKARAMIKAQAEAGPMLDLVSKNEQLTSQVQILTEQVKELCQEVERQKKIQNQGQEEKRGPGRPPGSGALKNDTPNNNS